MCSWKGQEWHSKANKCTNLIFLNEYSHSTASNAQREAAGKGGQRVLFFAYFILFVRNTGRCWEHPPLLRDVLRCLAAQEKLKCPGSEARSNLGLVARSSAGAVSLCFPGWVRETCFAEFCAPRVTPGTWAVLWQLCHGHFWGGLHPAVEFRVLRATNEDKILWENIIEKRIWTTIYPPEKQVPII